MVLLLDSSEEDVVAMACQSLYKFSEKGVYFLRNKFIILFTP